MAIANTTIQLKKSGASGNVPTSLNLGELALNYADGRLYYKNASGAITYISGATANSFATINANSSLVIATSASDILSLLPGNNITIVANTTSKAITLGLSNNVTIPGTLTTGSGTGGIISGASVIYANTFVANTGGITTAGNSSLNGIVTINYNAGATSSQNVAIEMYGANTKGGTGYFDFITANNISGGSANRNKWFRIDSNGKFQIINSLYTAAIFDLNDSGYLTVPGGIATSQYIQFSDGSKQYTANAGGGSSLSNTQILAGLQTVSSTANITFDWVATANNGQGYNFKVGDDTWIGDINVADTMSVRGQQNVQNAYIAFGNNDGYKLGRAGSGPLSYTGGFAASYIQFGDGTKQYTANAGSAGSTDTIARNIAQAAYDQANVTIGVDSTQNTNITSVNTFAASAFNKANSANVLAQAAFDKANTGSGGGFTAIADTLGNTVTSSTNTTIKFIGGSGILVVANNINPTSISISTIPGQQGLTVDWGLVSDAIGATYDFGSAGSL